MRITGFLIIMLLAFGLRGQTPSYKIDDLVKRVSNKDTVYVVNFWATWCIPCVKELPEFNKISDQYQGKPVKVLMVSLDFEDAYPKKLDAFIAKKKLKPEVVWFNETNANVFIPKIDNSWSGSIPATWIVNAKKEYSNFNEGIVTAQQLGMVIDRQLAE
ncbi:MAG TPA: TlpA disulfide reductase family protein [Flavipsychrobacter sp.]|nr:TlpA disulfide reductase family protein [Flavipsychrobacter sp.]